MISGQEGAKSYSRRLCRSCANASDSFVNTKPGLVQNDAILTVKHVVTTNLLHIYFHKAATRKDNGLQNLFAETETGFTEAVFVVCATQLLVFEFGLRVRDFIALRQYLLV